MRSSHSETTRSWARLAMVAGSVPVAIGLLALAGWVFDSQWLTTFAPGRVPMAPSTATLFVLFGALTVLDGRNPQGLESGAALGLGGVGTLVAFILFLFSTAGIQPAAEHLWLDLAGTVDGIPVGHMSPLTAVEFMLGGASYLLLSVSRGHNRARMAFLLAALLELVAVVLVAGYLLSRPILYGSEFIPPALNTSLGFILLGMALLSLATLRIWGSRTEGEPRPGPAYGLVAVVVAAVAMVLTPAVLLFRHQQADFEAEVHAQLLSIADLKVDQIREWREERIRDARAFYANDMFADLVERAVYRQDTAATARLRDWLDPVVGTFSYQRIAVLDSAGQPRIVVPDTGLHATDAPHPADEARQTLRTGRIFLEDFHRDTPGGPVHLSVLTPLTNSAGVDLAVLVIRVDPDVFLYPALQRWPVPSRTAETLLVRRDGDDVLFLNDLRYREDAALRLRVPLSNTELPAARAVLGESGVVEGIDYRGEPVVAAVRPVPDTDWKLVARVDTDEVYGPIQGRLRWTLVLIAGLLVGVVAVIGFLWQRGEKLHYRRRFQERQRHHTLLDSIGDAVIAADAEGRIELMNPVAERLTGWSEEEAAGRPLPDVFRIVNENTREPADDPVKRVLETGGIVGLANSTVLISRNGTERPIADSGAPVLDEDGKISGVILVFRDQTEERRRRRQLRQAVERSRLYLKVAGVMIVVLDREGTVRTINPRGAEILGLPGDQVVGRNWFDHFLPERERERVRGIFQQIMAGDVEQAVTAENCIVTADGEERIIEWRNDVIRGSDGKIVRTISSGQDVTEQRRAEEALRRNEARYRNLFNSIRDAILVTDTDRRIIACNPAFTDLFGYTEEEILGRETAYVYADREEFEEMGRQLRAHMGDPNFVLTVDFQKKSGEVFPGETSAFYLTDSEGEVLGFIGLIRDITERVEAVEELRKSEERYRDLFESAPIGIFHTRSDGGVLAVNQTMAEILGFDSTEAAMAHYADLGQQLYVDADRRREFLARLKEHGWVESFEYEARRPDGRRLWLEMNARIARESGDGTFDIEGFVWDITDRRQAEEDMRRQRTLLERTEHLAHIGSWEMDVETGQVLWSDELFRIFGRDPEEGAPSLEEHEDLMPPEDLRRMLEAVEVAIAENESYEFEIRAIRPDGEVRHCRNRGFPEQEGGAVTRIHGFVEDITAEKQQEQRQKELEDQLTQAQKMEAVGRLAGGVAHDFNNMLSVILGHVELARDRLGPEDEIQDDLDQVEQAAESSANLTRQLLAFAREQVATPVSLDLNETVGGMLTMLRRIIGENIELRWSPGEHVWPVKIDPVQVNQVLANLLVNARDAIDGVGTATIETRAMEVDASYAEIHPDAEPGDYVVLSVTDTGSGMDQGVLDRVFDPFFTTKAVGEGTGLGLATVYGIVRQNDGFVTVYSEPGEGATFKVHLPRYEGPVEPDAGTSSEQEALEGSETILVVEDQPAVLELVEKILVRLGYTVLVADSPIDAIELAEHHDSRIDLLITDVIMPEMNGRQLADRLQQVEPDIEVLFMSGYAESVIAERGVIEGGVHFLEKPFTREGLGAKVRDALNGR